ncbi:GDP-L-galactose phosphorylase 1-like, partial [Asparagus officinalis]|uniref:GDP-L-galactose phosphorylase 1-like n=1 Tax=Asparagus officinalis TaxID=4686 RepID=UPI00098DF495
FKPPPSSPQLSEFWHRSRIVRIRAFFKSSYCSFVSFIRRTSYDSLISRKLQWEDCSWKGLLKYDVTICERKIIGDENDLLNQLNDKCNSSFPAEFEKNTLQTLGPGNPTPMKILRENLLFCIASGEKESCQSQLIPSAAIPMHGFLILVNASI